MTNIDHNYYYKALQKQKIGSDLFKVKKLSTQLLTREGFCGDCSNSMIGLVSQS